MDKISEAIEAMGTLKLSNSIRLIYEEDIDLAIQTLKKQLPKKPNKILNYDFGIGGKCSNCSGFIREGQNYCSDCGQKLDWD